MNSKMKTHVANGAIPVVRVASLLRYVRYLEGLGAPVGRLLANSRIPEVLLDRPAAALPLESGFRFAELAGRALGTEHLGLHVGLDCALDGLGPYGEMLRRARTVHEHLRKGIALYNMLMTGQSLRLSEHGTEFRLSIETVGGPDIATYQTQMETLVVTIARIRDAAGAHWSPRQVSLAYRSREDVPDIDLFAGSRILRGTGETYFTIPRALMELPFAAVRRQSLKDNATTPAEGTLPTALPDLVGLQIESLLQDRVFQIAPIAETLAMSSRSLQRRLAETGLTYSQVLSETRLRKAADWLESTDIPIGEIAFYLGYTDASNFTRAFRRQMGISPQAFRNTAGINS